MLFSTYHADADAITPPAISPAFTDAAAAFRHADAAIAAAAITLIDISSPLIRHYCIYFLSMLPISAGAFDMKLLSFAFTTPRFQRHYAILTPLAISISCRHIFRHAAISPTAGSPALSFRH
jgi:hypothetical protein